MAFALIAQFGFLAKSALKMHCTEIFFRQKLLQIIIRNFWCKNVFDSPTGVASALIAQFVFLAKCLKNALYKMFCQTKVVTNQNLQLLCCVTFFDILHHYGVIAASQICSVSRKYCRFTEHIFWVALVCLFVFLFLSVSRITQKVMNGFRWNFHERLMMVQVTSH